MQTYRNIAALLALTLAAAGPLVAQSVDAGRGAVPLTVPEGYDPDTPTPLIVLLHGYSGSGAGTDRSWGLSMLADRYGFLTIAPDGERESDGNRNRYWNASSACCNFNETGVNPKAS